MQDDDFNPHADFDEVPIVHITREFLTQSVVSQNIVMTLAASPEYCLYQQPSSIALSPEELEQRTADDARHKEAISRLQEQGMATSVQTDLSYPQNVGTEARAPPNKDKAMSVTECAIYDALNESDEPEQEAAQQAPIVAQTQVETHEEEGSDGPPSDAGTTATFEGTEMDEVGTVITMSTEPSMISESAMTAMTARTAMTGDGEMPMQSTMELTSGMQDRMAEMTERQAQRQIERIGSDLLDSLRLLDAIADEQEYPTLLQECLGLAPCQGPKTLPTAALSGALSALSKSGHSLYYGEEQAQLAEVTRIHASTIPDLPALCFCRCPIQNGPVRDALMVVGFGSIIGLTYQPEAKRVVQNSPLGYESQLQTPPPPEKTEPQGGAIAFFSLSTPSDAQLVVLTPAPVTCLAWHPELPWYVAAGFDDGHVALYDLGQLLADPLHWPLAQQSQPAMLSHFTPVQFNTGQDCTGGRHHGAVWGCAWLGDSRPHGPQTLAQMGGTTEEVSSCDLLLTVGADGSALSHSLRKAWESQRLVTLANVARSDDNHGALPGTALAVSPHDNTTYLIASDRYVFRASRTYAEQVLGQWQPHTGTILALQCSPFESSIVASVGSDGVLSLWSADATDGQPWLVTVQLGDHGTCLAWSPLQAVLIAVGTRDGRLLIFDVELSIHDPVFQIEFGTPVTAVDWTDDQQIAVALGTGEVAILRVQGLLAPQPDDQISVLTNALGFL